MRKRTVPAPTEQPVLCQWLSPILDFLPSNYVSKLPACRSDDLEGTKPMLSALTEAVESHLRANICFASLSVDDVEGTKRVVIQKALRSIGLRQVMPTVSPAKLVAFEARPSVAPESDEKPWLVLAIDYSHRWYNVGLYTIGENGVVDPVEGYVDQPTIDEQDQEASLRQNLDRIISSPPADYRMPQDLRHVMVYGDDAKSSALRAQLADVLDSGLLQASHISNSIYDAPRILSRNSHTFMDTADFETSNKAAFGCKWRSRLYFDDRTEL